MNEASSKVDLLCRAPANLQAQRIAGGVWFQLVRDRIVDAVYRALKEPRTVTSQDQLLARGLMNQDYLREFLHVALLGSPVGEPSPLALVESITPAGPRGEEKARPEVLFSQTFAGEVTSADHKQVIVRFEVEDDLEERLFEASKMSQPLKEGQPVLARCELELLPPAGPMTDREARDYEAQYDDLALRLREAQLREDMRDGA